MVTNTDIRPQIVRQVHLLDIVGTKSPLFLCIGTQSMEQLRYDYILSWRISSKCENALDFGSRNGSHEIILKQSLPQVRLQGQSHDIGTIEHLFLDLPDRFGTSVEILFGYLVIQKKQIPVNDFTSQKLSLVCNILLLLFPAQALHLGSSSDSEVVGSSGRCTNGGESANVHPAFVFYLYHLGVKDLLSVSMVCKSLHTIICDDSLLWKHIHICQPLNEKITEDALLRLTERAQGTLQCLRLVDCCRITDDCLKRVLDRNPQVVKLGVPGCTRITIDGILSILRGLKSVGKLQVKHLEIGGLFGVTKDHFDELFDLLNIDDNVSTAGKKAMQKKEDAVLADQLGRMSVSRKRSYYHLFDSKAYNSHGCSSPRC